MKAMTNKVAARITLEKKIARCRENLSSNVPTKGPTIEYGRSTTAKATAALVALAWRSGEKSTKEASEL
jgi:hypothetical protein